MQIQNYESNWREDEKKMRGVGKYEIISRVAYLIGVPYWVFTKESETPKLDIYQELDKNKNARIIRNLCIVRASIERWFGKINAKMYYEYKTLYSVPDYIPEEALKQLSEDGIRLYSKSGKKLVHYVLELNRLISDRINNCQELFPEWIKWEYIRELFIMKDGFNEDGAKLAGEIYYKNKDYYPYKTYINWIPEDNGNILYHDRKFVTLLYKWHKDEFTDLQKVADIEGMAMSNVQDFVNKAEKVVMVVDCENTDRYRLCATLKALPSKTLSKIHKIMLFDDAKTIDMWRILESYTALPVEYIVSHRVLQNKSLVDIEMTALTCREHYRENVDSFIIVSSDSDYWGLIASLPDARFLVMIERGKSSPDLKTTLDRNGIFYCYTENFFDGNSEGIKNMAIVNEVKQVLEKAFQMSMPEVLDKALTATGIHMKPDERRPFIERHFSNMKLVVSEEGKIFIKLSE